MSKNYVQDTHSTNPLNSSFNESLDHFFDEMQIKDILNSWNKNRSEKQFSIKKMQNDIESEIILTEIDKNNYIIQGNIVSDKLGINRQTMVQRENFYKAYVRFIHIFSRHEAHLTGEIYEIKSKKTVPVPPENYHISINN